MILMMEKMMII